MLSLCDNGGKFADVFSFENDEMGCREIPLFFCDPMRSSQKPYIEKNHTLFRDIVPKGSSFDDFSQDTKRGKRNKITDKTNKKGYKK